jgi:hypothetical protein
MMFSRHVSGQLSAYIDGELAPQEIRRAEMHLGQCVRCRAECEQVRFGMEILEHVPEVEAPDAIWASIESALPQRQPPILGRRFAFAASMLFAVALGVYWLARHQPGVRWEVARVDGSPIVAAKHLRATGHIEAGEWIETDAQSRASVKVGKIGSVEIAPNTRVRVVAARPGEHRLALAHGEIRAKILAPPRLFFVDTPSGTAVDLGCEYTLRTGEDGFGLLQVTKGWVSFQWKGLESLVPAGASCQTRPRSGPGIPYFDDAPESLKNALEAFDSGKTALIAILNEARVRDTLTLWHLISRVEPAQRGRVYDRIAALTPVPAGVSREQALTLNPETLRRWKEELAWTW